MAPWPEQQIAVGITKRVVVHGHGHGIRRGFLNGTVDHPCGGPLNQSLTGLLDMFPDGLLMLRRHREMDTGTAFVVFGIVRGFHQMFFDRGSRRAGRSVECDQSLGQLGVVQGIQKGVDDGTILVLSHQLVESVPLT